MSNTPRTDAELSRIANTYVGSAQDALLIRHARELETELAEARQQLVERDALVERMRWHLTDCSMIAEQRGDAYLFDARDNHGDFYQSQALADVIDNTLTPSTALAEHDAEVRRKVLEEAAQDKGST